MNTQKCVNACSNADYCFDVDKWFDCCHYQCKRTTIILNYCIECGNNIKVKQFKPRCKWCQGILTSNEIEYNRELCLKNLCFLENHIKTKLRQIASHVIN